MSFYEIRFPTEISYGAMGGPSYDTEVVTFASGIEQRNINWSISRLTYNIGTEIQDQGTLDTLIAFFRVMKGKAHGFRFKDWMDYRASFSTGVLGTGVGNGTPTYQLGKLYEQAGASSELRTINKPVSGSVAIRRGISDVTLGVSAGNAAIDITNGQTTFVADASSSASSITVGATTQVVLTTNPGTLTSAQLLYLTGFTGADAALINNLAHVINSVTGSGPYTFTLATVTTGKTITTGSGAGAKYPQPSESLTWEGEYDVPCRFDTDELKANIEAFSSYNWSGVPIIELRMEE